MVVSVGESTVGFGTCATVDGSKSGDVSVFHVYLTILLCSTVDGSGIGP